MIYQELVNNLCSRLNFNTTEFAKKYNVEEIFQIIDSYNIQIVLNEVLQATDTYLTILFKYELDFNIEHLVININNDVDLKYRLLLIKFNNGAYLEIKNFNYTNNKLYIKELINRYIDISNIYYIDKTLYSNNFKVESNSNNEVVLSTITSLNDLDINRYTIYQVLGIANIFFVEDENTIESFANLIQDNNSIYIIPSNNVGSKANNTQSIATTENNKGNELNLSRVHNFFMLVKIKKILYNTVNNRISNKAMLLALDIIIPAIIKTSGGFIPADVDSCVSYKEDFLYRRDDAFLLYKIDFEFISSISNNDYMEDLEFIVTDITMKQEVII
jgi:hypothetical protein